MAEAFDRVEFHGSRPGAILTLVVSAVAIRGGLSLIDVDPDVPGYVSSLVFGWSLIAVSGFIACTSLASLIFCYPKLVLTPDGIRRDTLLSSSFWAWDSMGPIIVDFRRRRYGKQYWACAFTDSNYDLMAAHDQLQELTVENADITIPLAGVVSPLRGVSAESFTQTLNDWRHRYGRPEIEVDAGLSRNEAIALASRIKNRTFLHYVFLFVLLIVFFVAAVLIERNF